MSLFVCRTCGIEFESDADASRCKPCFKQHLAGLKFGFVGGGSYGRASFHDSTIGEKQREILQGAAEAGIKAEPVGTRRWV